MTDTKPTQGRHSEPGNYFVARTEEEFWQGLMSGEVFEASEKLPAKAGFYPEGGEHVVSEEEFYAPRKPSWKGNHMAWKSTGSLPAEHFTWPERSRSKGVASHQCAHYYRRRRGTLI